MNTSSLLAIRSANSEDVPLILRFIQGLADYERLRHECIATEESVRATLFGPRKYAEVIIASWDSVPVGFALFFHNYSTFLSKPGIYLEDLFVQPDMRGKGIGKALLVRLAEIAVERNCGRLEWAVLNWNKPAIEFYDSLGARPMNEWTVYRLTGEALSAVAESEPHA